MCSLAVMHHHIVLDCNGTCQPVHQVCSKQAGCHYVTVLKLRNWMLVVFALS